MDDDELPDADLVQLYMMAAEAKVENATGRALSERELRFRCDAFGKAVKLPVAPVIDVSAVTYLDRDGDEQSHLNALTKRAQLSQETLDPERVKELRFEMDRAHARRLGVSAPLAMPSCGRSCPPRVARSRRTISSMWFRRSPSPHETRRKRNRRPG